MPTPCSARNLLARLLLATVGWLPLHAQVAVDFTWIGTTADMTLDSNWSGSNNDHTNPSQGDLPEWDTLIFGDSANSTLNVPGLIAMDVIFNASETAYTFSGNLALARDLFATATDQEITFTSGSTLHLANNPHTISLSAGSVLTIEGALDTEYSFTNTALIQTGKGTLQLLGTSDVLGGIAVNGGTLVLGNGTAAGTGAITLNDTSTLVAGTTMTVSNNLVLGSGTVFMANYDAGPTLTLSGEISGAGQLDLNGDDAFILTHDNSSWSGGVLVHDAEVQVNHAHALGTGVVDFDPAVPGYVSFNTSATIGGLSGGFYDEHVGLMGQLTLHDGVTLTIDQSVGTTFSGNIFHTGTVGDGGIVKKGAGSLTLYGVMDHNGDTEVQAGTLVLSGNKTLRYSPNVYVRSGATLGVKDLSVYATVTLDPGSRLIGTSSFFSDAVTIADGTTLAPGFSGSSAIGSLDFTHLELGGGGIMEWNLQDPAGSEGTGWDFIRVSSPSTLDITATAGNKFTLKLISLAANGTPGTATGFTTNLPFSWLVFDTDAIAGFDPANFALEDSAFMTDAGTGAFSLTQTGNNLYLNFTPVPEPSTYALMALGAGFTGFAAWRKRRRA